MYYEGTIHFRLPTSAGIKEISPTGFQWTDGEQGTMAERRLWWEGVAGEETPEHQGSFHRSRIYVKQITNCLTVVCFFLLPDDRSEIRIILHTGV